MLREPPTQIFRFSCFRTWGQLRQDQGQPQLFAHQDYTLPGGSVVMEALLIPDYAASRDPPDF